MIYQMVIEPTPDSSKFVPGSWNFYRSPGMTIWESARDIAEREGVRLVRVLDENGKSVPEDK